MNKRTLLVGVALTSFIALGVQDLHAASIPNDNISVEAQNPGSLTGTVKDKDGAVIGANIRLKKNQAKGTTSDVNGKFTLSGLKKGDVLIISFVGYKDQEIVYNGQQNIVVTLSEDSQVLNEVVVTALGIKREKKALGYAMQEVKGDDLLKVREPNVTNALSGKVSGVQIIRSSNGPGGSSKIVLRGNNSLTGNNQPLIVVDGVPMDNFTGADNNDYWNPSPDMGNGLSDINPEDIESMTVLKGASAAALYGSRAGNGVIQIVTKTGKKSKGLGLTISSSVAFEELFMKPKLQNSFGQGTNGAFKKEESSSWGPKIEGQEYTKWNGEKDHMRSYDNIRNYFRTGVNFTENVSFSQQYEKASVYTSLTRTDDKSNIPGSSLDRTNLMVRAISKFGTDDKWSTDTKVQYIKTNVQNRPINGVNSSNSFFIMYSLPRSMDIRDFKNPLNPDGTMRWYGVGNQTNPYWSSQYNLNNDTRDRFLLNASLKYKATDWLDAELRFGSDQYSTSVENKVYAGSPIVGGGGRYSVEQIKFYENNYSFLINAHKDNIWENLGVAGSFGGNLMARKYTGISSNSGELIVPNLFTLNNGVNKPSTDESYSRKKINSLYGTFQLNWNGYLFLDGTLRNDWSSSLSKANRSFLYPSLNFSWIITEMLRKNDVNVPSWINFAKVRASMAQVGNDLEPYQLYNSYIIQKDPLEGTIANLDGVLYNQSVRSELIKSYELGAEVRMFDNRLGIDFAWYRSNATRQLLKLPMDNASGYNSKIINAGNIQNQGFELMLNADIIRSKDFNWHTMLNLSHNRNKIVDLYNDGAYTVNEYELGRFENLKIVAIRGGNYGEIWGTTYKRVEDKDSEYFGKLIVDGNGLPVGEGTMSKLGDQQPDVLMGLTNSFSFKGVDLSFLIDARIGGKIFSGTNRALQSTGSSSVTVVNGDRKDMVVDGVVKGDNGKWQINKKEIKVQDYWNTVTGSTGNLGIGEANIYNATSVRLRNISLNYTLPQSLLSHTPITKAKIGFSCNNVWMLKSYLNGIDPESVFATGTNAVGYEFSSSPTSRSFLFNITLGF
ncbi:SusC/RagA family TonB-linked outer membrane protein [Porphyromonas pogonae]|uniref:SusC/RagA family TonB-linked outer membrane protein n=1 Tax=Porphyromonas pogonae TaxID=867595 RepID=UPI002E78C69B|nr:SusC/RagA family TonB-linked outer membrane protein [Porphyromonas pogonae]